LIEKKSEDVKEQNNLKLNNNNSNMHKSYNSPKTKSSNDINNLTSFKKNTSVSRILNNVRENNAENYS